MKSDLKERRNAAICMRVYELLGTGKPIMQVYSDLEEEFWLDVETIRKIYNKNGHYQHKW
ncbi:MAG: hypothetical protein J6T19_08110 [Paludibacteraceae bacterium]|nr:hypothetical protein [Paludibacteraceae bacterium]